MSMSKHNHKSFQDINAYAPAHVQERLARRTPEEVWALAEQIVSQPQYTREHNYWKEDRIFQYHPKYKGLSLKYIRIQEEKAARQALKAKQSVATKQ